MKYYILEPYEANEISYFKLTKQHHVDATVGLLVNNKYALPTVALYGGKIINGIEFKHKIPRSVNPHEWVKSNSGPD